MHGHEDLAGLNGMGDVCIGFDAVASRFNDHGFAVLDVELFGVFGINLTAGLGRVEFLQDF